MLSMSGRIVSFGASPRLRDFGISEASLLFRRRREETRSTRRRRPRSVRRGPAFGAVGPLVAEKPIDVLPALLDLSRWLKRDKIPFAIIGGTAVGFVGRPRTTKDVDAVVLLGEHTWESFAAREDPRVTAARPRRHRGDSRDKPEARSKASPPARAPVLRSARNARAERATRGTLLRPASALSPDAGSGPYS